MNVARIGTKVHLRPSTASRITLLVLCGPFVVLVVAVFFGADTGQRLMGAVAFTIGLLGILRTRMLGMVLSAEGVKVAELGRTRHISWSDLASVGSGPGNSALPTTTVHLGLWNGSHLVVQSLARSALLPRSTAARVIAEHVRDVRRFGELYGTLTEIDDVEANDGT